MLKASYCVYFMERGRKNIQSLHFTAQKGESVFIHTTKMGCELHADILSGLYGPSQGNVFISETDLYALPEIERSIFRRDHIGLIPFGGGWIPEISMMDQIALPLKLSGMPGEKILAEVEKRTSELLPMHSLYNLPGHVSQRRQAHGAILRAAVNNPELLILDRAFDGFHDIDSDVLWRALTDLRREGSVLLYFSSDPPPVQINWTQSLPI